MPSPYLLATLQFAVGMVITVLIARNHVLPRLAKLDFHAALAPVLLLHGVRLLGLSFLAPDQVESGLGFMWATFSLVAPALVLSHLYVVRALLRHRRGEVAPVEASVAAVTA